MEWSRLLHDGPVRLRYVTRYSNCRRVHVESVAEHSYYVALYAMLIARGYQLDVNHVELYEAAIVHDMEEAASGDVIRVLKKHSAELDEMIDSAAIDLLYKLLNRMVSVDIFDLILTRKSLKNLSTLEGRILCLADYMSVVSYLYQEHLAGNRDVIQHRDSIYYYHSTFTTSQFDFARDVVDAIQGLIDILCK